MTKRSTLTFPKSIVGSSFLDLQDFIERERDRERERKREREYNLWNVQEEQIIYGMYRK